MVVSNSTLFPIVLIVCFLLSVIAYFRWKDRIISIFRIKTNPRLTWGIYSFTCAMLLACLAIALLSRICVVYEGGRTEHIEALFVYKTEINGKPYRQKLSFGCNYILNATDKPLGLYSVGYGSDSFKQIQKIKLVPFSIRLIEHYPHYCFEEAPNRVYVQTKDKNVSGVTKWVLDFWEKIPIEK